MKKCHDCGANSPDRSVFCPRCGSRNLTPEPALPPEQNLRAPSGFARLKRLFVPICLGIIVIAAGVVVILVLVIPSKTESTKVPNVMGMTLREAKSKLKEAGLGFVTVLQKEGGTNTGSEKVIDQSLIPNAEFEKGTPMSIEIEAE